MRTILNGGPDGGACAVEDQSGPCRGFTGVCSQLPTQFATVPVLPGYPSGLQDYTCQAFPNDNRPLDSLVVGAISVAVGIPVTIFLAGCFEMANECEAPESWLEWTGWRKLVFGAHANRKWHYTRGEPPLHYIRWYCRCSATSPPELAQQACQWLWARLTYGETEWEVDRREAEEEEAEAAAREAKAAQGGGGSDEEDAKSCKKSGSGASTSSSVRSAKELRTRKRVVMATGLLGVYICWAIFTWFIFTCALSLQCAAAVRARCKPRCACADARTPAFSSLLLRADGMLIYELLGESAEVSFAHSWGVSYGLQSASEWQGIVTSALQAAIVIAILERLCLTRHADWLEQAIDYHSMQAMLFGRAALGFGRQIGMFFNFTKRVSS